MRPRVTFVVMLIALTASNKADPLVFNSSDALYSAMDAGVFNSSSPLILTLLPGRYLLPRAIVIMSPEITLMGGGVDYGSWTELECTTTSSNGVALFLFSRAVQASNINLTSCINTALIASPLPGENIIDLTLSRSSFLSNPGQGLSLTGSLGYVSMIGCVFDGNGKRLQGMMNQASSAAAFIGISSISVLNSSLLNNQGPATLLISSMSPSSSSLISHSMFINNSVSGNGGAITLLSAGNFSIGPGCLFQSNAAKSSNGLGGAIYAIDTSLHLIESSFVSNVAGSTGGAIWAAANFNNWLSFGAGRCLFSSNTAYSNSSLNQYQGAPGVHLEKFSSVILSSSSFTNNLNLKSLFAASFGGGLALINCPVSIMNSTFSGNSAGLGGGLLLIASNPMTYSASIVNSSFVNNSVDNEGGAIFVSDLLTLTLQSTIFISNRASGDSAAAGGLMSIDTSVLAENVTFINSFASNQGGDMVLASISGSADSSISQSHFSMSRVGTDGIGGSIFAFQIGNLNILGSSFESCGEKDVLGGAIHVEDTNLTLTSTSFTKNLAGEGGAVWAGLVAGSGPSNMSSIPIVFRATNSTFNGNTAQGAGGAIYLSLLDEADILNCTFQGDTAALGMGSAVDAVSVSLLVAPAIPCSPPSQDTVSCTSSSVLSPPAPPLPPLFYPPNLPGPPPDHDSSLAIGLGVGLGCGILLSLILLLWFFWLKKVTASETANKETIDNPMFSPVFSPHPGMTGNQSSITSASLGCDESDGSRVAKQMIDASSSQQATETAPNTTVILIRSPSFQDYDDSAGGNDPMRAIKEVSLVVSQGQDGDMLEIFQPIGQGGSGTVYKGRWRNLDVAVKTVVFPNRYGDGVGARQRAVTEAAVCCSLVHPNVVSTFHYDIKPVHAGASVSASKFGEHGKGLEVEMSSADHMMDYKLFLVQELCVASVTDLLADGHFHFSSMDDSSSSPLSLQGLPKAKLYKIFCLLENVAQGMEYIHNMALLHGDIKPQNIMVKRDRTQPWGYLAKMTDFGIAIVMTDSSGSKLSHVSNFGAGTPFYCAPEITYLGQASTASDVYSFGVLMIETFTSLSPAVLYERYCKDNLRGQGQAAATESRDKLRPSEYLLKVLLCEEQGGVVGEDWPSHTCFESFKDLALQCLQEDSMARPSFSAIVKEVKRMKAEYPPELIDQEYEVSEK